MNEVFRPTVAKSYKTPYSRGGDYSMEGKPDMTPRGLRSTSSGGSPEHKVPVEQKVEKSERMKENAQKAREALRRTDLPVDMRRMLEQIAKEGMVPVAGSQDVEEPVAGAGGAGGRGGEPPTTSATPPSEGPNGQNGDNAQGRGEIRLRDRNAADLIARFRQQGGEGDREQTQRLRLDLSGRIRALERERDELGAREGSTTPEGELTPAAAAGIADIDSRIREIQGYIADTLPISEGVREGEGTPRKDVILVHRANRYVAGLLSENRPGGKLERSQINDLSKLTEEEKIERQQIVTDIKEYLKDEAAIDTQQFPSYILYGVRHFTELREELISEILFKSFEDKSETNEWEVGLYAASNLDMLFGFMSKDDNDRYKELFSLRTATRFFQTMNSTVIKGTFDQFGHSAENINYQHFENMRDIGGSGLAMRLFEQAYRDALATDKTVKQDRIAQIKEYVETTFNEINEAGLIKSEYAGYRTESKMDSWEVQRALAAGRTFFNITLRAAENIATGQVPMDRGRYTSPPQEDMVRILNWNQWLLARFGVGGDKYGRHGEEFLKMSTDRWREFLRYKGAKLDKNKIKEFGGVNVEKMEEGGQYRTSGVYSGWRMENLAFNQISFDYNGKTLTVQEFRDLPDVKAAIAVITKRIEKEQNDHSNRDPKDWVNQKDQEEYRKILMPVVDNLNYGLSMLLKNGAFGKQDEKLGYLLRTEIWKKIARTNTPLMIDYLTDIEYEKGTLDKAESIRDIRRRIVPQWSDEQWAGFRKKVVINYERMIAEGMGNDVSAAGENEFSQAEQQLVTAIQREGEKLAPHLADIVFPYMPFMNDMPFEKFSYARLGQTFYKRRSVNDLGGYNKGQSAFAKIMSNPGGIAPKEVVEAMGEIVAGIESPDGPRTGIEANFPAFHALLDTVMTDPGKRQAVIKAVLEFAHQNTSLAQKWAGIKASSFVEAETGNLIDETERAGILTPDLARYLKKKKHISLQYILWMLFRDVFIVTVPIIAVNQFVGAVQEK